MNTNINEIQDRYTADTIHYESSVVPDLVSDLNVASTLMGSDIPEKLKQIEGMSELWSGEAKEQYLGLRDFIRQYQEDFSVSIEELRVAAAGLQTLLGDAPKANVIKEIDNG